MTLWYDFDDEGYEFEYDASYEDIEGYLMSLPNEELQDPLAQAFEALPKKDQIEVLEHMEEPNFACPNFMRWLNEEKEWCISEFLMERDILELFKDELNDEFEEEAYEQYRDGKAFRRDPYAYNGLRQSDFY